MLTLCSTFLSFRKNPPKLCLGFFICIALLSSCARSPVPKQYFFGDTLQPRHVLPKTSSVLLVSSPTAAPAYQSKDMLYVQQPYQLGQFARHSWASPPAEMLAPLLMQRIQNTGDFYAVVSSSYGGLINLRLDTKLLALYQEFQGKNSQIVLEIQAELTDVIQSCLLKSQRFSARVNAPENTPYGGVIAANQAVREILNQIAGFVSIHAAKASHQPIELPKPNIRS